MDQPIFSPLYFSPLDRSTRVDCLRTDFSLEFSVAHAFCRVEIRYFLMSCGIWSPGGLSTSHTTRMQKAEGSMELVVT